MRIGYTNDSYPEQRTIIQANQNDLIPIKSFNHYFIGAVQKRLPFLKRWYWTVFHETILGKRSVDGLHFFNSVSATKTPWISTYETCIPRISHMSFLHGQGVDRKEIDKARKYVKLLAGDKCKKIIAMSRINEQMQRDFLSYFPEYKVAVEKKMVQLYPPQVKIVDREFVERKQTNNPIKFIFVGKFFNLKGGNEIVDVFHKISQETDYKFELLLISLEDMNNHAFGEFKDDTVYFNETKVKIASCPNITLVSYLENKELLERLKEFDVGLLPTWADTFGYSVLEMQAVGCPVISSNVRALEEINNNEVGWILEHPVTEYKEVRINSLEEKENFRANIQKQLETVVLDILKNPEQIKEKRLKAYDQVTNQHNIETYHQKLNEIYREAFGN